VAVRQQPGHHRVAADVVGVRVEQLLQLVEEQAHDAGLGGVETGDDATAPSSPERLHESF
jgi:hypothetical protein